MPHRIFAWEDIANDYRGRTLLMGNGASMAVAPSFGYRSLLEQANQSGLLTTDVAQLFKVFGTNDFELILRLVWQASHVNAALHINDARTHDAYVSVRNALIQAVRVVHPPHEIVAPHLPSMYAFLSSFDTVLSLNYDLLVYWTITYGNGIHDGHLFKDCFVNQVFYEDWTRLRGRMYESRNTLVFYPHGNLALCRNRLEQEYKIQANNSDLLSEIFAAWSSEAVVPLFVSEGQQEQKVASMQSSYYLSTVYREILAAPRQALTIYGWGVGDQDRHLLRRMRGTPRIAVSVFQGNQVYCEDVYLTIQRELGPTEVVFFDSQSQGCQLTAGQRL